MKRKIIAIILSSAMILTVLTGCQKNTEETELLGEVTKIDGSKITLAIGTMEQNNSEQTTTGSIQKVVLVASTGTQGMGDANGGTPPEMPDGATPGGMNMNGGAPPEMPDGTSPGGMNANGGTPPEMPDGTSPGGMNTTGGTPPDGTQTQNGNATKGTQSQGGNQTQGGTPPEMPNSTSQGAMNGEPPQNGASAAAITLTGEEKTITIGDDTQISIKLSSKTSEGSLEDIKIGTILSIKMKGTEVTSITVINGSGGGMDDSATDSISLTDVDTVVGETKKSTGVTYS